MLQVHSVGVTAPSVRYETSIVAVITVTATLADGTESAKSKTEEVAITVTKAKAGEFIVSAQLQRSAFRRGRYRDP